MRERGGGGRERENEKEGERVIFKGGVCSSGHSLVFEAVHPLFLKEEPKN